MTTAPRAGTEVKVLRDARTVKACFTCADDIAQIIIIYVVIQMYMWCACCDEKHFYNKVR